MENWLYNTVDSDRLMGFCISAMRKCGLSEEEARVSAEVLVTTDTWGVHSHGTKQLLPLLRNFRYGSLKASATHGILSDGPSWALLDGKYVMPLVVSTKAMQMAIEKARITGIAYVGVQNSGHFGTLLPRRGLWGTFRPEQSWEVMSIKENWKYGYTSQKKWGWPIAIKIFCGGTAGGTYILSVLPYLLFSGRIFLTGVYASLVLVLLSVFILVAETSSLWRLPRAFFKIKSPLALGAISLSLLIVFSIATIGILSTGFASKAFYVVGWSGVAVSLLAIIYPGALMGLMKAIPFWSGSGPSLLLLSAALVSGCAVVTLAGGLGHLNFNLSRVTLGLLVIHGLSLLIYIRMGGQGS